MPEKKVNEPIQMPEKKEISLKEELTKISTTLENNNTSIVLCKKLIEGGVIRIYDPRSQEKEPPALTVNGDIVAKILIPIIQLGEAKKEQLLTAKEQILGAIEQQLNIPTEGNKEDKPKDGNTGKDTSKK
jgi:hypothetical protein